MLENHELKLASDFVEKTNRTIFLTGKAGTGKTTFLHEIKTNSLKRLIVVAPTGVAAINAKGVTIHSFFQMPFGPILPEEAQNQQTKSSFQRKFNRNKIDILKSLDLLIIDEISMVRADLLDGIDQVLRRYKNRNKVFGGVQVLMIGDLQQLSPVVKDHEWSLLKAYYATPYFFSSRAFQQIIPINIELKHIYRQDNQEFIKILNEIRNNKLSQSSVTALNKRYLPEFSPSVNDKYITLTTHNNRASEMNKMELNKIKSKSYLYSADVEGKFPEYSYPTHERLELKAGAQVMFIKNDSTPEKRFYNGKIGHIVHLSKDEVSVRCPDDDFDIVTTREIWENVNYTIHQETKEISEHKIGSFAQIPLRLAWAITIHKSQGLTFEKAIIDAQASFAHGQTYVALSRCKTLEGVVLKTPIDQGNIISDKRVSAFNDVISNHQPDERILQESQKVYQLNLIHDLFNFYDFIYPLKRLIDIYYKNKSSIRGNILEVVTHIKDNGITVLLQISDSFQKQLEKLSLGVVDLESDVVINMRLEKALSYFLEQTNEKIKNLWDGLKYTTENKEVDKEIRKQIKIIEELMAHKLFCLKGLSDGFSVAKYLETRAIASLQKRNTTTLKKEYATTTEHQKLFSELSDFRLSIANSENMAPYQVFTQKSLFGMCEILPINLKLLRAINGMGKVRVQKYGDEIVEIISAYCAKNKIEVSIKEPLQEKPIKEKTHELSLKLYREGLSIAEIAQKRGFVSSTIESHLAKFVLTGELKVTDVIDKERYQQLKKILPSLKFEGLTDLKSKVDSKFTYGELRLVSQILNQKK